MRRQASVTTCAVAYAAERNLAGQSSHAPGTASAASRVALVVGAMTVAIKEAGLTVPGAVLTVQEAAHVQQRAVPMADWAALGAGVAATVPVALKTGAAAEVLADLKGV